jgi:hypothetical protein
VCHQWYALEQLKSIRLDRSHAPLREVYKQDHYTGSELNYMLLEECIKFTVGDNIYCSY